MLRQIDEIQTLIETGGGLIPAGQLADRATLHQEILEALSRHLDNDEQALVIGWPGGETIKTVGQRSACRSRRRTSTATGR